MSVCDVLSSAIDKNSYPVNLKKKDTSRAAEVPFRAVAEVGEGEGIQLATAVNQ